MSDERKMGANPQHGGYKNDEEEGPDVEAHQRLKNDEEGQRLKNDEEDGPDVEAHSWPNPQHNNP